MEIALLLIILCVVVLNLIFTVSIKLETEESIRGINYILKEMKNGSGTSKSKN